MKAKFTKGEWVVKGASMSMGSNYRGKFTVESSGFSGNISEASIANAHLIKVAPEMYDLINDLRHAVSMGGIGGGVNNAEVLNSIDSLLAKARGEK